MTLEEFQEYYKSIPYDYNPAFWPGVLDRELLDKNEDEVYTWVASKYGMTGLFGKVPMYYVDSMNVSEEAREVIRDIVRKKYDDHSMEIFVGILIAAIAACYGLLYLLEKLNIINMDLSCVILIIVVFILTRFAR